MRSTLGFDIVLLLFSTKTVNGGKGVAISTD